MFQTRTRSSSSLSFNNKRNTWIIDRVTSSATLSIQQKNLFGSGRVSDSSSCSSTTVLRQSTRKKEDLQVEKCDTSSITKKKNNSINNESIDNYRDNGKLIDEESSSSSNKITPSKEQIIQEIKIKKEQKEKFESSIKKLNKTISFPTIIIPSSQIHNYITNKSIPIRQYYAKQLDNIHPPIKLVHNYEDDESYKLLLIEPGTDLHHVIENYGSDSDIRVGPEIKINIEAKNILLQEILESMLPKNVHPVPVSFEQLGTIAHYNLKPNHIPYKYIIGYAHLFKHHGDNNKNKVETVVNKIGDVEGLHRTYPFEVIGSSNEHGTTTTNTNNDNDDDNAFKVSFVETSTKISFDLRKVYWCSRLSGERRRLITDEFLNNQYIADACCGVGAVLIQAVIQKNCHVVGNDINPYACEYAKENAKMNGIKGKKKFWIECNDARDFIRDLPMKNPYDKKIKKENIKVAPIGTKRNTKKIELPDHLLINLPTIAPTFLNALRFWPISNIKIKHRPTRVHVYTFAKKNNSQRQQSIEDVAIDMIANELLPESFESIGRRTFLNKLGCFVQTREVREVAPGKHCICVSFFATPKLIRHMKGDFADV